MITPEQYNKLREEELILKAAESSGASKSEMLHGSLFVTFTPGFVDVLSQELKGVSVSYTHLTLPTTPYV